MVFTEVCIVKSNESAQLSSLGRQLCCYATKKVRLLTDAREGSVTKYSSMFLLL